MKTKHIKISEDANQSVETMLKIVNEGYLGGKISRTDLISWILIEFQKAHISQSIESIRKQSFDQVRYLESVVKLLKESRRNGKVIPSFELPAPLKDL